MCASAWFRYGSASSLEFFTLAWSVLQAYRNLNLSESVTLVSRQITVFAKMSLELCSNFYGGGDVRNGFRKPALIIARGGLPKAGLSLNNSTGLD